MGTNRQKEWLRLHLTKGLGRAGIIQLINTFGNVSNVLDQPRQSWQLKAGLKSPRIGTPPPIDDDKFNKSWEQLVACQARIISLWDDDYPPLLRTIHDPPALLYLLGKLQLNRSIAIVGSRRATRDALRFATDIASALSRHDITVISGLARGIDTAAHIGGLTGTASTVAVLGSGINCIYPAENNKLFHQIAQQGAILSEYPPGAQPFAGHFPARNRIISGLSQGVLVVEAAHKSGSLITADFALEQGRDVYAAPGSVYNANCEGNLHLLKQGAILTTSVDDILSSFNLTPQAYQPPAVVQYDLAKLTVKQKKLFDLLQQTPLHVDQLAQQSGLTAMDVSAIVLHLELEGLATAIAGGRYIRGLSA